MLSKKKKPKLHKPKRSTATNSSGVDGDDEQKYSAVYDLYGRRARPRNRRFTTNSTAVDSATPPVETAPHRIAVPRPDEPDSVGDTFVSPSVSSATLHVVEFSPERFVEYDCAARDLEVQLAKSQTADYSTRWIHAAGYDRSTYETLARLFDFHSLVERSVNVPQRSKLIADEGRVYMVLHALVLDKDLEDFYSDQILFFIIGCVVITMQESAVRRWATVPQRIESNHKVREHPYTYLVYLLLNEIVEDAAPIISKYGDLIEDLEITVSESPTRNHMNQVQSVKRELLLLRKALRPMSAVLASLMKARNQQDKKLIDKHIKTYYRGVHSKINGTIELIETYRELCVSMNEQYAMSHDMQMNSILFVLTIVTAIFIPASFLAGVFGMNFRQMPILDWPYGYYFFWVVVLFTGIGMLIVFRIQRWL